AAMLVTVTLPGPAPWGFRISGGRDFGKPIAISKVVERGKAAAGDLRPGDVIVTINGESTAEMLNMEAQNKIKQSPGQLRLEVQSCPDPPRVGRRSSSSGDQGTSPWPGSSAPLSGEGGSVGTLCGCCSPPSPAPCTPQDTQGRGILSRQNSSQGSLPHPPPCPPSAHPPRGSPRERRPSLSSPNTCDRQGSEPAMRRLEQDSEVYKMLQENRELRAAPRQSSTFRLLQEALEDEAGGEGGAGRAGGGWQGGGQDPDGLAVRIQEGRYRHPSCYTCTDCGLNLKMRGHFWVGDELFCEKHARLRYQGPPPVSPHS
ncbi:PDLI2 protein, partial [Pitta sordida]|nr:PDLI2 protein [Pitta sordida]